MKRLKVTYFTTNRHDDDNKNTNIGNQAMFLGLRNIMRRALGPHDEDICFLESESSLPGDTDIALVCGMLQIQDQNPSIILQRIAEVGNSPFPVKLNLGLGSFYFPAFGIESKDAEASFVHRITSGTDGNFYRDYLGFDAISCRDQCSAHILSNFGLDAAILPCPSFFSSISEPRPLLRSDRQIVSVLSGMSPSWDTVPVDVHGLYQSLWAADKYRMFVSHDENEAAMLSALGIPFVFCQQADAYIRLLAQHDRLISFKGSDLALAWSLGVDATHIGFHRREQFGDDFGAALRTISPWSEEAIGLTEGAHISLHEGQREDARRRWIERYLHDYIQLIRKAVKSRLSHTFDFTEVERFQPVQPVEVGEEPSPLPEKTYFSKLFHSTQREFAIPLERLRSHHSISQSGDTLRVAAVSESRTLVFGPYIRLSRGLWRLRARVSLDAAPENDLSIVSEIRKGALCLLISQRVERISTSASAHELKFDYTFFNPSDTGFLEFLFVVSEGFTVGRVFEFADVQLSQILELGEEFMKLAADNAAREMTHRLTEQLFEAGDYSEIMTMAPKITKLGLFAPTVSFVLKSALRLNTVAAIESAVNMAVNCDSSPELRAQHAHILAGGGRMTEAYLVLFSDPRIQWFPEHNNLIKPVLVEIGRSMNRMLPAATAAGRLRRLMSPPAANVGETPRAAFDRLRVRSEFGFPDHVKKLVPKFLGPPTISIIGNPSLVTQREELQRGLEQAEKKILSYKVPDVYELEDVFINRHGEIWKADGTFLRRVNKSEVYPTVPTSVQNVSSLLAACTVEGSKNPYLWCTRQLASFAWRWELTGVDMAIGISDTSRTWVPESIRLAAKETPEIVPVGDAVFVRRLILSNVDMHFLARHDAYRPSFDRIIERAEKAGGQSNTAPVYISRRDAVRRSMRNELQLEEALQARGVKVITLTGLSLVEKISLLRHAPLIIGAHGAGLGLVVFGKIGLKVLEILPVHTPFSHHRVNMPNLSRIMGHEHHHYLALPVKAYDDDSWELDMPSFLRFLEEKVLSNTSSHYDIQSSPSYSGV
jgi:hypothetical protein